MSRAQINKQRADQLRAIPLEAVLQLCGAQPDRHDKYKWHTGAGTISVTGAKFINWNSHNHANDGIKLGAFADQVEIIGGHFHHNTKDGIDTFVSGQDVSIVGANCSNNTVKGIDAKIAELSGVGAGNGGYNRRMIVSGCVLNDNAYNALSLSSSTADVALYGYNYVITNNCQRQHDPCLFPLRHPAGDYCS